MAATAARASFWVPQATIGTCMRSASSRKTRLRISMTTSTIRRSAPLPERNTAMAVSMRSAWVKDAPLSIAILVAAVSCPLRVPTISSRISCLHYLSISASPALGAIRFYDFRHGHAELLFDQHDFAARDQPVVHIDVDRLADTPIELQHCTRGEIKKVSDVHPGAPQHCRDLHRNVEYRLEIGGAAHHRVRGGCRWSFRYPAAIAVEVGERNVALILIGHFVRLLPVLSRATCREIARDQFVDRQSDGRAVADDAAVRPVDATVAKRDVGFAKHHQPALEAATARNLVETLARCGIKFAVDAHHQMRCRQERGEAFGRERCNFSNRLACHQG